MLPSVGLFPLLLLGIISKVTGELTVQSDWVFPQSPDYSTSVSLGSTVYFQWTSNLKNQFRAYLPNGNVSHVDVWVTGETISKGYHKLAGLSKHPPKKYKSGFETYSPRVANFDVTSAETFQWEVVVPAEELKDEATWVFRFIALGDDPAALQYQVSSPLFRIVDDTKSNAASSSSSPSPSSSSSNSNPSHTALSTGAKIGIAIGASAAAICTCALLLFLFTRRRRLNDASYGRVRMASAPLMEIQQDVSYASKGKA